MPTYQTARAKQFSIGTFKFMVCPIFMFFLGKFVIIEYMTRREAARKVNSTV